LNHGVDQRSKAVIPGLHVANYLFDDGPVGEVDLGTSRVHDQFFNDYVAKSVIWPSAQFCWRWPGDD